VPLQTLTAVRASRDILRGRTTVVKHGTPGKIVDIRPDWSATTYTVEFAPLGTTHRGVIVTLPGLTEGDIEAD
jgi:hypothetical protein